MTSEEAFEIILRALEDSSRFRVISKVFDCENFGNFVIKLQDNGEAKTFTCDKSQIIVDELIHGRKKQRLAISSLYELSERRLLEGLDLSYPNVVNL